MKDAETYRSGIIELGDKNLVFFEEDYTFHFMVPEYHPFDWACKYHLAASDNDFLYGTTYDNRTIAIYIGNFDGYVYGRQTIGTDMYIVENGNVQKYPRERAIKYDAIEFVGKNLSKVFFPQAISLVDDPEKGQQIEHKDDTITYHFDAGEIKCTLSVFSLTPTIIGVRGTCVTNEDVCIKLSFDKTQTISELRKHLNNIRMLLSFMTYRASIDFDHVYLMVKDEKNPNIHQKKWDVFSKLAEDTSKKTNLQCLTFEDLGDSTGTLLKLIYGSKDKKPSYSLGFIPEADKSVNFVNNDTIKAICSGLECEIVFSDIQDNQEAQEIKAFADKIKELVQKHQHGDCPLSQKSYDKIYGNIRHWGMATADSVIELYRRHEKAMQTICGKVRMFVEDSDINEFIKYRNDITHGSYRVNNIRIANTAYVLSCLVYCCLLARIGIDESKIEELCRMKIGS